MTAKTTDESHLVTPTVASEVVVEARIAKPIPKAEMIGEAHPDMPIIMTGMETEAHNSATTTSTSEMGVDAYAIAPLVIKESTAGSCESIATMVNAVVIEAVGTVPVSGQADAGVPIEVTTMTEMPEACIPATNADYRVVARTDSTIVSTVASQGQMPMTLRPNVGSDAVAIGVNVETTVNVAGPLAVESWGRNARMVEGIFRIIEGMEPPWVTLSVLDIAVIQFPNVNRDLLRHTIMTVLMSQRDCVVRLTRAELRLGPRMDREGNAFVELDLDYSDRYNNSH